MNAPAPPPLAQVSIPQQNVLAYAGNQVFERAVFRLIGWFSIVTATLLLLALFVDLLQLPRMRLPVWWLVLVAGQTPTPSHGIDRWLYLFSAGVAPLGQRVIAIPLLAGGIGCLRRYHKTRAWMLLYAVPQLLLFVGSLIFVWLQYRNHLPQVYQRPTILSDLLYTSSFSVLALVWPTMIIYLMTRPYVARLYEKQTY